MYIILEIRMNEKLFVSLRNREYISPRVHSHVRCEKKYAEEFRLCSLMLDSFAKSLSLYMAF